MNERYKKNKPSVDKFPTPTCLSTMSDTVNLTEAELACAAQDLRVTAFIRGIVGHKCKPSDSSEKSSSRASPPATKKVRFISPASRDKPESSSAEDGEENEDDEDDEEEEEEEEEDGDEAGKQSGDEERETEEEEEDTEPADVGDGKFFERMEDDEEDDEEEDEEMEDVEAAVQPMAAKIPEPAAEESRPTITIPPRLPTVTVEDQLSSEEEGDGNPRLSRRGGRLGTKFGDNNPCARCERNGVRCEARKCLVKLTSFY
jgi:hypothetical protein